MKHYIDPTIDFVFKLLFGVVENIPLLLDFLNKTLQPSVPIAAVTLLNPYNEREFTTDKLTIVDLKAQDENGTPYQIEIQLQSPKHLPNRILYNWSGIYRKQLSKKEEYEILKPVISIWLLTKDLIQDSPDHHHIFEVWDRKQDKLLSDHLTVHLIELKKWIEPDVLEAKDHWPFFFKDGRGWLNLPDKVDDPNLRCAMKVLQQISDKEQDYYRYLEREDYVHEQATQAASRERAERGKKEAEQREKEALALAASEREQKLEHQARADAAEAKTQKLEQQNARLMAMMDKLDANPDKD